MILSQRSVSSGYKNFVTLQNNFRKVSSSSIVRTNFNHLQKTLKLECVKDLPCEVTVPLIAQEYKPSKTREVKKNLKPILMLHGLFGSKQNYRSVGKAITDTTGHLTLGVDLRNHGQSVHASPHNYSVMADDIIKHINDRHLKDVILIGHSMGAKVAMAAALLRPDLISKLVVIDNAPVSHELDVEFTKDLVGMCQVERKMIDSSLATIPKMKKIDGILNEYEKDPKVRLFLMSNIVKNKTSKAIFRIPVLNFLKDGVIKNMGDWPYERLQNLKFHKPVLVLKAQHSNFITKENKQDFEKYFSQFEIKQVNSGHWIVSEKPEQFLKEVIEFIT